MTLSSVIFLKLNVLTIAFSLVACVPPYPVFNTSSTRLAENLDQDKCLPFDTLENGKVVIEQYLGQTAAFFTCNKNFTLIGKSIILTECVDGVWKFNFEETLPKCEPRCPPPPYLEHGDVNLEKKLEDVYSPTGTYLEGTVATYKCKKGYILEPPTSSFRLCEKGQWSGSNGFCKPTQEITCPPPPVVENGYIQPGFPVEFSVISVGQEVLYQCLHGFKLVGVNKIECSDQGVWLPDIPSCHRESVMDQSYTPVKNTATATATTRSTKTEVDF